MLTPVQTQIILDKIEALRKLDGKKALRLNNAVFKFLNDLNANGFIDADEYNRLDQIRYKAFLNIKEG